MKYVVPKVTDIPYKVMARQPGGWLLLGGINARGGGRSFYVHEDDVREATPAEIEEARV